MNDKELLEYAAKAGVVKGSYTETYNAIHVDTSPLRNYVLWRPFDDDGDAFRLAVQCSLEVSFVDDEPEKDGQETTACVGYVIDGDDKIHYLFEFHSGDVFNATRRAIVRAAAEIGKAMP